MYIRKYAYLLKYEYAYAIVDVSMNRLTHTDTYNKRRNTVIITKAETLISQTFFDADRIYIS